jgi:hypothetical protein
MTQHMNMKMNRSGETLLPIQPGLILDSTAIPRAPPSRRYAPLARRRSSPIAINTLDLKIPIRRTPKRQPPGTPPSMPFPAPCLREVRRPKTPVEPLSRTLKPPRRARPGDGNPSRRLTREENRPTAPRRPPRVRDAAFRFSGRPDRRSIRRANRRPAALLARRYCRGYSAAAPGARLSRRCRHPTSRA